MAERHHCSTKTIQRQLDKVVIKRNDTFHSVANLLMDTTSFGGFCLMVFKDSLSGDILYKSYVKHETNALYIKGLEIIGSRGITIQSIICDGRKGLLTLYNDIPIQRCVSFIKCR